MAGHHRPELPHGPVEVRHMQPYQAVKTYRCPGCDHEIRPGTGHKVVVPRDAPEDRRHFFRLMTVPAAPHDQSTAHSPTP